MQSPADRFCKPWEVASVGIASLVCPAGHGDEVGGRNPLKGMKKQGAGASRLQLFRHRKSWIVRQFFIFLVVFG